MLIQTSQVFVRDSIYDMIASLHGNDPTPKEIQPGVYEIGHFGGTSFLGEFERYPDLEISPYGVCDNINQLLTACPELETSDRKFVIALTSVQRKKQSSEGGWRWHKWGPYIGKQNPQCEYLYDEPEIEEVFCYHIYEQIEKEEKL